MKVFVLHQMYYTLGTLAVMETNVFKTMQGAVDFTKKICKENKISLKRDPFYRNIKIAGFHKHIRLEIEELEMQE